MNLMLNPVTTALLRTTVDNSEYEFDPAQVTSGPVGFFFIAVLAIAAIVLCIFMTRTLHRMGYREQVRAEIAEELAAMEKDQCAADAAANTDTDLDSGVADSNPAANR